MTTPTRPMITVFSPYFAARTPERQAELDLCLARNLACPAVGRLILLVDDGHQPPRTDPKLEVRHIPQRPTYRQWIELSGELPAGEVSLLANSDIHFDETLAQVRQTLGAPERFLALSRYEQVGSRQEPHPNPRWSQDVWGLRTGQTLPPSLLKALDIPLGVPRCDNKIAYLFAVHGWTVHNPMQAIRSVHVHETQQRHYDKKTDLTVMGGVAYVHPSSGLQEPSELEFDVWARNVRLIRSVKLNRSLDDWLAAAGPGNPPHASPGTSVAPVQSASTVARALREGSETLNVRGRFKVYRLDARSMAVDVLSPCDAQWLSPRPGAGESASPDASALLAAFVPPVVSTAPLRIRDRPQDRMDVQFWQYPAATEQQAFENHLAIPRGANVDAATRTVHTYLGLPWATYIDKKHLPDEVNRLIGQRLAGLRALCEHFGYRLKVHTVCQQIHWRRLLGVFLQLGISDLHLSHAEAGPEPTIDGQPLSIHSWPLFAPNIEVADRRGGLDMGKPVAKRSRLASFVGAHMPHYRSDVRLRLLAAAQASGRADVLVDLGDEWHFNKVVYQEQVKHQPLAEADTMAQATSTRRYNEILCDSVFSLCPEGAGPNTLRLWESLAVGAIPVVFAPRWLPPPSATSLPPLQSCAVFVQEPPSAALFERLAAMPRDLLERMQRDGMRLYQYARRRTAFGV